MLMLLYYLSPASISKETTCLQTVGAIITIETAPVSSSAPCTKTYRLNTTTGTSPVHSSIQPTPTSDGGTTTTETVPVSSSALCIKTYRLNTTTETVPVSSSTQPTPTSDGGTTTTETVPVSSSTQPTTNFPSDGTTTASVIIAVAVVIILVVIVFGVFILLVLCRTKKRKQQLEINQLQNVTMEGIKQKRITEIKTSSNDAQQPYAEIRTAAPPNALSVSEKVIDFLNQNSPLTSGYGEIELQPHGAKHTPPAKPPRYVGLSDPACEEMESSPLYQDVDQHCDYPTTTNLPQESDIYTEPVTTSSHTVETDSGMYETMYSEPVQPSLFTDPVGTPSNSEDLQPYAPIYTLTVNLPKSDKVLLEACGSNIQEIRELGMGHFGKVILAETVGLSAKDLRLSESDDDKSKSILVAVKTLKSDAPNATKEAFEKEIKFMSRLTDKNVVRILGVCYEDTPFIVMEYMEKGDLNQYLQKFKIHSTTDSEPQGQITTSTLVHMATQIASAMRYLASHKFVHRDLATRNCLVGPNYLVKISDFGMSRSLYDSHYYCIHGRFALPVRWMPFECFYGKFSQKSDVWAFGVTMWEIFTLAKEQPYNDMSDKQVIEDALKGKNRQTLARPDMCPLEVYKIMLECWAHNSKQRATFEELFQLLTSIHIDE